jgi:TPR repeat protein
MAQAQYQLYRELLRATPEIEANRSAADWLKAAADNGHAEAQFDLGRAHLSFNPVLQLKRNPEMAQSWWERAAVENGYARALRELAWRYEQGADGFPRDAKRAIELYQSLAAGYLEGSKSLEQNPKLAADYLIRAEGLIDLEERVAAGDPKAQAELGRNLLQVANGTVETRTEGIRLLEQAAAQGDTELQYELGAIFIFGRSNIETDLRRGHEWWSMALEKHHVKTMEYVAKAHQDGRFGYSIDLLKSKALVTKLVEAYRDGAFGVQPDPAEARRWSDELKHLDRLFDLAGGNYQSPTLLQAQAESGDPTAQYQLGRQLMVSGPVNQRKQGLQWIERAAEGGLAEAQYQLVTFYDRQSGIMRKDPDRGIAMLTAAAEQNHLPAMGALALGFEKGRYGLERDLEKAKEWYQRLLERYSANDYLGEVNDQFIPFNRQRLVYVNRALEAEREMVRRYESASPKERQIIEIEERYRQQYQDAVNALPRGNGTQEGKLHFQKEAKKLLEKYNRLRDEEIQKINSDS